MTTGGVYYVLQRSGMTPTGSTLLFSIPLLCSSNNVFTSDSLPNVIVTKSLLNVLTLKTATKIFVEPLQSPSRSTWPGPGIRSYTCWSHENVSTGYGNDGHNAGNNSYLRFPTNEAPVLQRRNVYYTDSDVAYREEKQHPWRAISRSMCKIKLCRL
jgi:hypothetical protein